MISVRRIPRPVPTRYATGPLMDGYSVNEAAAVLGIPEGRVWELLARGVLSGTTEVGGDMRVFLRETAVAEAPKREGNGHGNGGSGGNGGHGEITPFRELLTEFRNLTERYGQALLALGEARGEVASLRGRVDLLEARLDHRLPWSEAPTAWTPAAETPEEATADEAESALAPDVSSPSTVASPEPPAAESSADHDEDFVADILGATLGLPPESRRADSTRPDDREPPPKPRPAHRASSRDALAGFAEALERAQDPATADVAADIDHLPGAQETADAVAAYRRETETATETATDAEAEAMAEADAGDSPPQPPIEPMAELEPPSVAEAVDEPAAVSIVRPGYNTDTPEPDWIAEEDLIISAGEDASVRADELAHQAATVAMAELEVAEQPVAEPEVAWPEVPKAENAAALASPEVQEPEAVTESEPPAEAKADEGSAEPPAESRLAPVEIAAEPPASDDVALLVGPDPFSEPPIVPREPAFWESGARGRAPFPIAQPDPWEASPVQTMPVDVKSPVPAGPPAAPAEASTEGSAPAPAPPESEAAEAPPGLSPAAQAGRAAAARRRGGQPRGPAARAIRRLRLLLD